MPTLAPQPTTVAREQAGALRVLTDFIKRSDKLHYLAARWQDEAEYEPFSDYRAALKREFERANYTFDTAKPQGANLIVVYLLLDQRVKVELESKDGLISITAGYVK